MQDNNQDLPKKGFDSLNFNYDFSGKDFTKDKGFFEFQQKDKSNLTNKPVSNMEKLKSELNNKEQNNAFKSPEQISEKLQSNFEQQQRMPQQVRPQPTLNFSSSQFYYRQFEEIKKTEDESAKKFSDFKERIKPFASVSTITEARELSKKILPVKSDVTIFRVGGAKCTIIDKPDMFRITLDNDTEMLCYDFVP